jgi:hypothetical protein
LLDNINCSCQKEAAISAFRNTYRLSAVILCKSFSVTYLQREEGARERSHLLLQLIILFDYKLILILKKNPVDLSTS